MCSKLKDLYFLGQKKKKEDGEIGFQLQMMQKEFSLRWRAKGGFFPMTNVTAVLEVKMEALP